VQSPLPSDPCAKIYAFGSSTTVGSLHNPKNLCHLQSICECIVLYGNAGHDQTRVLDTSSTSYHAMECTILIYTQVLQTECILPGENAGVCPGP